MNHKNDQDNQSCDIFNFFNFYIYRISFQLKYEEF